MLYPDYLEEPNLKVTLVIYALNCKLLLHYTLYYCRVTSNVSRGSFLKTDKE